MTTDRGFPLILTTGKAEGSVLTVEAYCKWYSLYVAHPDGSFSKVPFTELEAYVPEGMSAYVDHAPNPEAALELATARGWLLDPVAYDAMVGRFLEEGLDMDLRVLARRVGR